MAYFINSSVSLLCKPIKAKNDPRLYAYLPIVYQKSWIFLSFIMLYSRSSLIKTWLHKILSCIKLVLLHTFITISFYDFYLSTRFVQILLRIVKVCLETKKSIGFTSISKVNSPNTFYPLASRCLIKQSKYNLQSHF